VIILLTTFFLTVLIDLTVAIEIGMVLAAFLFMRNMIQSSEVSILSKEKEEDDERETDDSSSVNNFIIPHEAEVFEISGPLFFGAAHKFKDAIKFIEKKPKVLIIRMRKVPIIDATGIRTIEEVYKESKHRGTKLILCEVDSEQVIKELKDSRLLFAIGKANVTDSFEKALERCNAILAELPHHHE
jgi:SulP family sulfate permease